MSNEISREKLIKEAAIALAERGEPFAVSDVTGAIKTTVNRVYISRVLSRLVDEGMLAKGGVGKGTRYVAAGRPEKLPAVIDRNYERATLQEHLVMDEVRAKPFWSQLNDNVRSIIDFSLSEMINNAIDHSQSKKVRVFVRVDPDCISLGIDDSGVGVFRNVMLQRELASPLQAIQDILKGKTTTAPRMHSGEGIFFTSKAVAKFQLSSYGFQLVVDNSRRDVFVQRIDARKSRGTYVFMQVDRTSTLHLTDLFRHFTLDDENQSFATTEVNVKLYKYGTVHISRSQAKRVLSGLEKFKKVVLDFSEVPTIGQGFADEVFRVFQSQHPGISIEYVNAVDAVEFMIARAKNTAI